MHKLLLTGLFAVVMTGCANVPTKPLAPEAASGLAQQKISYTTYKKPNFSAMTPANVQFGLLGAAAGYMKGNDLINGYHIEDPALKISQTLIDGLKDAKGMVAVNQPLQMSSNDVAQISKQFKEQSRYVMDVQTLGWQMMYFPMHFSLYRIQYNVRARLIDTQTNTVVSESACTQFPKSADGAPTWDQLIDKGAERMKSILDSYALDCSTKFKSEMFSI